MAISIFRGLTLTKTSIYDKGISSKKHGISVMCSEAETCLTAETIGCLCFSCGARGHVEKDYTEFKGIASGGVRCAAFEYLELTQSSKQACVLL